MQFKKKYFQPHQISQAGNVRLKIVIFGKIVEVKNNMGPGYKWELTITWLLKDPGYTPDYLKWFSKSDTGEISIGFQLGYLNVNLHKTNE